MWSAPPALHTGVPLRISMNNVSVVCFPLHQSTQVRLFYKKVICWMKTNDLCFVVFLCFRDTLLILLLVFWILLMSVVSVK